LICVTSNKITSEYWSTADIYTQGTTIFSDKSGNLSTVLDYCTGSKLQVNKNWCYESPLGSGNYVDGDIVFDCPNGCVDGACVKSK